MSSVTCGNCERWIDDDELLCPLCGAAQIPQMSKTELARQMHESDRGARAVRRGAGWGALAGVVVAVLMGLYAPGMSEMNVRAVVWSLLGVVLLGMIVGGIVGLVGTKKR